MWILCIIFFISGAAGLLFETLWLRGAGLAFGNSVWASSITLAAYMGGLGLGNVLAGRFGHLVRRPVRTYALVEVVIAVSGALLVPLLPALASWLAPLLGMAENASWLYTPLHLIVVFLLLMIPTTAMGATLPLLVKALCQTKTGFGTALGHLYGFNTLGAMAGAIAGETFLVQSLGLVGTGLAAALLNLLAAGLSLTIVARALAPVGPATIAAPRAPFSWRAKLILLASCLAGAALLAAEVVWFRFLRLFFLDTDATFVAMLAVILAGIACGGLLTGMLLKRWPQRHDLAASAAALCGVLFVASYRLFDAHLAGSIWYIDSASITGLSMLLMFPTALASGVLFTLLGQAIHALTLTEMESAAALTTANTTGAMLGALLAAFVLLPRAGIENALWLIAATYVIATLVLVLAKGFPSFPAGRWAQGATLAGVVVGLALFPFGRMKEHLDTSAKKFSAVESSKVVAVREGLTETLQYLRREWQGQPVSYRLMTNGFSMSDSEPGSRRYMGLYAYWPAALHPDLRSALLISYGLGNTARSLTEIASLRQIDVVDISRDIIDGASIPYPDRASPLRDPRVRVHIDDGRYFLQATAQRFDLITSEPPPPRASGVVSLYTEEYFRLMRARLNEGGLVTYWLPVHDMASADAKAIIKGFCNAFDDCGLWGGYGLNWMLTGGRHAAKAPSAAHFSQMWRNQKLAPTLAELGLERPELLGTTFMADAQQLKALLGDALPLTDNFPKRYSQRFPASADFQLYADWMDVRQTAERFRTSPWIAAHLPAPLREASAPYFLLHPALNEPGEVAQKGYRLQMITEIMNRSDLKTPIYWLLDSSPREATIARGAVDGGKAEIAYALGVDALARRDSGRALAYFETALASGDKRAVLPLLFSACRAGQGQRAQQVALRQQLGDVRNPLARCW